jgi:hypothetical protein
MKNILLILLVLATAGACTQKFNAPADVRARALEFAQLYARSDTEYVWGAQDPLRVIRIDCSGLVVMCYKYALVDTAWDLPFDDATAADMHDHYSRETKDPLAGDLIFMGEAGEAEISHIALFKEKKDGKIYFIDATEKDAEGDYPAVNGVSERNYPEDDQRFKSFGILQIILSGRSRMP